MIPLHCSTYPEARLPKTPHEYLADWRKRAGLRNTLTADALNLLDRLGNDRIMVCENAPDAQVENLKWSIYQDCKTPELFVVVGKLGVSEFASVQFIPDRTPILEREGFSYQRLNQFQAIASQMKEDFLGLAN